MASIIRIYAIIDRLDSRVFLNSEKRKENGPPPAVDEKKLLG